MALNSIILNHLSLIWIGFCYDESIEEKHLSSEGKLILVVYTYPCK